MDKDDSGQWQYKPDGQKAARPPQLDGRSQKSLSQRKRNTQTVQWTASEYIEHQRGAGWYLVLVVATAALAVAVWWLTGKDYFAAVITVMTGVVVGVFTVHKPKEVTYQLTNEGLVAGDKLYPYTHFKSFSIIREGGLSSFSLMPIKRFVSIVSVYYDAADEAKIIDILGQRLAFEDRGMDRIERLSRRLRF